MKVDPRAGKPPTASMLVNVPRLMTAYYTRRPDLSVAAQRVAFGTSGHRGSSLDVSFNEAPHPRHHPGHLRLPATAGHRRPALPRHRHPRALRPGLGQRARSARGQRGERHDRRPPGLHADARRLARHPHLQPRRAPSDLADGIVITPSHNPPRDGGFKYNPPNGGPADTQVTSWIQDRANALLADELREVKRIPFDRARRAATTQRHDYMDAYVGDLANVVDLDALRARGPQARRRSPGRRRRRSTGGRSPSATASDHRRERRGRSHLPLHDASTGTARSAWTARRPMPCSG